MWNENEYMTKVKPISDKLMGYLKTKGINFVATDGTLNNAIFTCGEKEVKISHHSLYGFSRMGANTKQKGEKANEFEFVPVADEVWINGVMKQIIEFHFKN